MIKKISISLIIFSSILFGLEWQTDLDKAFVTAKKEHKVLMVMVESEHCGWCKKMLATTFEDTTIQKKILPYITVKVLKENKEMMKLLPRVNIVPTVFFIDENNKVIERILGYAPADGFTSYLRDVETILKKQKK